MTFFDVNTVFCFMLKSSNISDILSVKLYVFVVIFLKYVQNPLDPASDYKSNVGSSDVSSIVYISEFTPMLFIGIAVAVFAIY